MCRDRGRAHDHEQRQTRARCVTLCAHTHQAIQNTEVAKQDILTAQNEYQEKVLVAT